MMPCRHWEKNRPGPWASIGAIWAFSGSGFFVGPKQRHRQTLAGVAEIYAEKGIAFPEAQPLPEFDEHHGPTVVKKLLSRGDDASGRLLPAHIKAGGEAAMKDYFRQFQDITRRWARRELTMDGIETWQGFRARISKGIDKIAQGGSAQNTLVFSSGGPVAASVGYALNLDDVTILELSWKVRNAALAEFVLRGSRFSQVSFNALPHLTAARTAHGDLGGPELHI